MRLFRNDSQPAPSRFRVGPISWREALGIGVLLLAYLLCRVAFAQLPVLKQLFIWPSGQILSALYGAGEYTGDQWRFVFGSVSYLLDASCSGTTFFSLLLAYLCFRVYTHRINPLWLVAAYPIALIANVMRVHCAIFLDQWLRWADQLAFSQFVHVLAGVVAFLCCFVVVAWCVERPTLRLNPREQ